LHTLKSISSFVDRNLQAVAASFNASTSSFGIAPDSRQFSQCSLKHISK
jgi:hypothetical protein